MANFEIEGTLMKKLPVQSGTSARGEWAKQEFVIEFQEGRFPGTAVFSLWGQDKVNELSAFSIGDIVKVVFGISSREYSGRYYTDLRAREVMHAGKGGKAQSAPERYAPAPSAEDLPAENSSDDDLPF